VSIKFIIIIRSIFESINLNFKYSFHISYIMFSWLNVYCDHFVDVSLDLLDVDIFLTIEFIHGNTSYIKKYEDAKINKFKSDKTKINWY